MKFDTNKPIYRQLTDFCISRIDSGEWLADDRIPSTKDLAVRLAVNNRTVIKAYDELAEAGIIYQRRGMGYYVAADAREKIAGQRRAEFLNEILPDVAERMRALGLTLSDIAPYLP